MFEANAVSAPGSASKKGSKSFRGIKCRVMMRSYVGKIRNSRDNFKGMVSSSLALVSKGSRVYYAIITVLVSTSVFAFLATEKFLKKTKDLAS